MNENPRERAFTAVKLCRLLILGILAATGCGSDEFLPCHPAKGTATFRGTPMQHARVTLYPVDAKDEKSKHVLPSGVVGEDGTYRLTTYRFADGAPAGTYALTVAWPSGPDSESESPSFIADRLQRNYDSPKKPLMQVTIEEGDNTLPPIELN
jgi:hypothetical protein